MFKETGSSFSFTDNQYDYVSRVREFTETRGKPLALIETYGCQQNVSDSEKIRGMLTQMGFGLCEKPEDADLVIFNTCAVRDTAEQKVLGNVGALKIHKRRKPELLVGVCGCMTEQDHVVDYLKKKCQHVDFVFGTHTLSSLPEILYKTITSGERVFDLKSVQNKIAEDVPVLRESGIKAYVTIMYGCNNFCTYCIVPYTRGRERSRQPEDIIEEVTELVRDGYKDITLLGQNVNSYGKDLGSDTDFAALLEKLNATPGDFRIRFMTSHPKDLSYRLVDTISACEKVSRHIHLPVQSGSDRILKLMNRHYTSADYLKLVDYMREKIDNPIFTSDIIVGFPGETEEDFEDTVKLIEQVRFDTLFTFLYSKRNGTPAEKMTEQVPDDVKHRRFDRLLAVQNAISRGINEEYDGKIVRVLCEGKSQTDESVLTGRTDGNKIVNFKGDERVIGSFADVLITKVNTWSLFGEQLNNCETTVSQLKRGDYTHLSP